MNLQFTTLASPLTVTGTILGKDITNFSVQAIADIMAEVKFEIQDIIITIPIRSFTINGQQFHITNGNIRATVQFTAKVPLNAELLYANKASNKGISRINLAHHVDFSAHGIAIKQMRFIHDEDMNRLLESDIEVEDVILNYTVDEIVNALLDEDASNRNVVLELILSSPIMN